MTKNGKLPNYLAYHRRRLHLTQEQMAELVGCYDGSVISRFESGERLPNLKVAMAYEVILSLPLPELFGGIYESVEREAGRRARRVRNRMIDAP